MATLTEWCLINNSSVASEWNYERNSDTPNDITSFSNKKRWWKCSQGHEWEAIVANRVKGRKCPYCSGKKVLQGYNDLYSTHPEIAAEWHPTKNGALYPSDFVSGSHKKVWWLGKCGHEWQASICDRSYGTGCPICAGQIIVSGFNDLQTEHPEIAAEWHPTKNGDLKASHVASHSNKHVWWLGKCGHEWYAQINGRVGKNNGCPYCKNRKLLIGFNDLGTTNPYLAKQWNYERNGSLTPQDVQEGSEQLVWWIGSCGHEWRASILKRKYGEGCPICAKALHTSFPEKAILYYISREFSDIKSNYKPDWLKPMEMDIYIPEAEIAIEYDGAHWHTDRKKEEKKNKLINNHSIKLIRIREPGLAIFEDCICIQALDSLDETIQLLYREINSVITRKITYTGNIEKDTIDILNSYDIAVRKKSMAVVNPELAKVWHPTKNGILKPCHVASNSHYKVWWQCEKGHEWKATIYSRASGIGCPYCSGRLVQPGFNDLATLNPELASEWLFDKNANITPDTVSLQSNKKVWWKCKKGHEWEAAINSRYRGNGCPICSNQSVQSGINDLETVNPLLAKEWNHEKNGNLTAQMFSVGSSKKVWWICDKGHEWKATIYSRTSGSGCPICSNQSVQLGINDLETINPLLAKEWNHEKNGNLTAQMFSAGSSKKVWWKCDKGHEWKTSIVNRNNGTNCPYCAGIKLLKGFNDFKTVNPKLAEEWNYEKNDDLIPEMVTAHSSKKVWWRGKCGHEWQASVNNRMNGSGCIYCARQKALVGYSDLQTTHPEIADEWNYDKNDDDISKIMAGSHKKVWWKCKYGHEWQAVVYSRTAGAGCPICEKLKGKKKSENKTNL